MVDWSKVRKGEFPEEEKEEVQEQEEPPKNQEKKEIKYSIDIQDLGLNKLLEKYEKKVEDLSERLEKKEKDIEEKSKQVDKKKEEVDKEKKEWEEEKERKERFENLSEKDKQKKIHYELRGLLRDYPMKIKFKGYIENIENVINNLVLIDGLLSYAKYHTSKEEILKAIEHKQKEINKKVNLKELRKLFFEYNNDEESYVGRNMIYDDMLKLISPNINYLIDQIQYFSLVVPRHDKNKTNLRTTHGFGASKAEEYEQAETEEGKKIDSDTQFKVDPYEGKVIPVT